MDLLSAPRGELTLDRYPPSRDVTLRAWDAADEYVLDQLETVDAAATTVLVNDRWGALTAALTDRDPVSYGDSYVSSLATRANLERNEIDPDRVSLRSSLEALPDRIDLLVVRVPKSLSLLEHQLHRVAPLLHAGSTVVGAGMVKDIHTSTLALFEQILGPTTTSLAKKKARLIFTRPDADRTTTGSPWPRTYTLPTGIGAASGLTVTQHAGVFSSERLDIGSRFLLENLPDRQGGDHVVDLGCGNGVLGLAAGLANPRAVVTFVDESSLAVAAAEATYRAHIRPEREARFVVGDGLLALADGPPLERGSVDLVLNNPPLHTHKSRSDETAWRMFHESRNTLRPGGELWVVGNQSLGYHAKLKRLFGNYTTVASNRKFVILRAVRT